MAFIERGRNNIVHRSFQPDRRTLPRTELLFGRTEQGGANAMKACLIANINGDNVPAPAKRTFADQETDNSGSITVFRSWPGHLVTGSLLGYQSERRRPADVARELKL